MSKCVVCGAVTDQPFVAAVNHFRPFEWHDPKYIMGNIRAFGFWSGLRSNVSLYFPFLNTLLNWKYRKMALEIDPALSPKHDSTEGE